MELCILINIFILIVLAIECNKNYAALEDESLVLKDKAKYISKIILACAAAFIALMYIYNAFGVTDESLNRFLITGAM